MKFDKAISKKRCKKAPEKANTFKHESFAERVSNISIDVVHTTGPATIVNSDEVESYFVEALRRWCDNNLTQDFVNLKNDLYYEVQTYAQLVHHKDAVLEKLLKHVRVKGSLSYDAMFDLIAEAARDLQTDFYPYFGQFLTGIVSVLQSCSRGDADTLNQGFTCLARLYKILWRSMVQNIADILQLYLPLLADSQKDHIRRFAAESFGFLLRKCRDVDGLLDKLYLAIYKQPDLTKGVGYLLFEMVKGIKQRLHSCTDKVVSVMVRKLGKALPCTSSSSDVMPWQGEAGYGVMRRCVAEMMSHVVEYVDKQDADIVLKPIMDGVSEVVRRRCEVGGDGLDHLHSLLHLTHLCCSYKGGVLITDATATYKLVVSVVDEEEGMRSELRDADPASPSPTQSACASTLLTLITDLLLIVNRNNTNTLTHSHRDTLLNKVFADDTPFSHEQILHFTQHLCERHEQQQGEERQRQGCAGNEQLLVQEVFPKLCTYINRGRGSSVLAHRQSAQLLLTLITRAHHQSTVTDRLITTSTTPSARNRSLLYTFIHSSNKYNYPKRSQDKKLHAAYNIKYTTPVMAHMK